MLANGNTKLTSFSTALVTMTIFDQFGDVLDAVYDGDNVVMEKFSNAKDDWVNLLPIDWTIIVQPDIKLKNGIKLDKAGWMHTTPPLLNITAQDRANWAANMPITGGWLSAFAMDVVSLTGTATQAIRVRGHDLTNTFTRVRTVTKQNIAVPLTVASDTAN